MPISRKQLLDLRSSVEGAAAAASSSSSSGGMGRALLERYRQLIAEREEYEEVVFAAYSQQFLVESEYLALISI